MSTHVQIVAHMLAELRDSEERQAMMQQLLEDDVKDAAAFEDDFGAWIDDAQDEAGRAASCRDCAKALSRRLSLLVEQFQNLASACSYIITGGDDDDESGGDTATGGGSWWWYKSEIAAKGGPVDLVQARVLQMMHFFGLADFLRDLICLAVLDPYEDIRRVAVKKEQRASSSIPTQAL